MYCYHPQWGCSCYSLQYSIPSRGQWAMATTHTGCTPAAMFFHTLPPKVICFQFTLTHESNLCCPRAPHTHNVRTGKLPHGSGHTAHKKCSCGYRLTTHTPPWIMHTFEPLWMFLEAQIWANLCKLWRSIERDMTQCMTVFCTGVRSCVCLSACV